MEMYIYGQLSEVQMVRDLDLDLGLGQGHINIHSTCRTTCRPNHVTVALHSTEIWPFEFGGGDRPRNVQLWAIVGSSNAP